MQAQINFQAFKHATLSVEAICTDRGIRGSDVMNHSVVVLRPGLFGLEMVLALRLEVLHIAVMAFYFLFPYMLLFFWSWLTGRDIKQAWPMLTLYFPAMGLDVLGLRAIFRVSEILPSLLLSATFISCWWAKCKIFRWFCLYEYLLYCCGPTFGTFRLSTNHELDYKICLLFGVLFAALLCLVVHEPSSRIVDSPEVWEAVLSRFSSSLDLSTLFRWQTRCFFQYQSQLNDKIYTVNFFNAKKTASASFLYNKYLPHASANVILANWTGWSPPLSFFWDKKSPSTWSDTSVSTINGTWKSG